MLGRIYVTGAPGCGVTTLGRALGRQFGVVSIDTDDHYWVATDPPYQVKRAVPERIARIHAEQESGDGWVISGSLETWGAALIADAELIVFLEAPTEVRLERLRRRERARFGDAILPGGVLHETHREFIEWTALYEQGTEPGRSRPRQEVWLGGIATPILRLQSTRPVDELVSAVLRFDDG